MKSPQEIPPQQNGRHTGMLAPVWCWMPQPAASVLAVVHVTRRGMLEADGGSETELEAGSTLLAEGGWKSAKLAGDWGAAGGLRHQAEALWC